MLRAWRDERHRAARPRSSADPEVTRYLFGGKPLDAAEARAAIPSGASRLARTTAWASGPSSCEETGELIGWAGLQRVRLRGGLRRRGRGRLDARPARGGGTGYATEAAEAGLRLRLRGARAGAHLRLPRTPTTAAPSASWQQARHGTRRRRRGPARRLTVSMVRVHHARRDWTRARRARGDVAPARGSRDASLAVIGYDALAGARRGPDAASRPRSCTRRCSPRSCGRWPGPACCPANRRVYRRGRRPRGDGRARLGGPRGGPPAAAHRRRTSPSPRTRASSSPRLHVDAAREGVWLHADVAARHGVELDGARPRRLDRVRRARRRTAAAACSRRDTRASSTRSSGGAGRARERRHDGAFG